MSRLATVAARPILMLAVLMAAAIAATPALAQAIITMPESAAEPTAAEIVVNAGRLVRGEREACNRSNANGDIVVCGSIRREQSLPVPEVYGPVRGSTDGRAVDPNGPPCGASISNNCYGGVDLISTAIGAVNIVRLLIDPDRNLGEGAAIPSRFRGSNR